MITLEDKHEIPVTTQEISEGSLDHTPEFYKNLTNLPSTQRLRSLDVNARIPFVSEYLIGTCSGQEHGVQFVLKYKVPPLVTGIILKESDGACTYLYPDGDRLSVYVDHIVIGGAIFQAGAGDRFALRVYNLDLPI